MAIAKKIDKTLAETGVKYEVIAHQRTESASRTAQASHVSGNQVTKTVVLHDGDRYVMGVVPSTHRVELDTLGQFLNRRLTLATEAETARLFDDCALGADPPLGAAYDLPVVIDEALFDEGDIYFEGGDHQSLVHVSSEAFAALMRDAQRARFSHHT
ncbi:aminoacyl-tRNA deacylase [Shumkonia mesophila]|uniref:aminoacyl-tRNA deacylase n=1 Tax=Shumkonia mesophila TaxID=2838854 RepID=UPI00293489CC|nr:YbaK/EbsC family protein [Shumkonia mesophila]